MKHTYNKNCMFLLCLVKSILINGAFVGLPHLFYVFHALKKYNFPINEWYMLGLRLGITKNKLDEIEATHHTDVSRCLIECLSYWLYCVNDMYSNPPIWRSLLVALIGSGSCFTADRLIDYGKSICVCVHV